jgi:hypothetical protein
MREYCVYEFQGEVVIEGALLVGRPNVLVIGKPKDEAERERLLDKARGAAAVLNEQITVDQTLVEQVLARLRAQGYFKVAAAVAKEVAR